MSRFALILAAAALAGCEAPEVITGPDQCLRADLFKQCMTTLPAGPQSTKYNDWDEVVAQCQNAAYYQSLRRLINIKPECRI